MAHHGIAFQLQNNTRYDTFACGRDDIQCFSETTGRLASNLSIVLSSEEFSRLHVEQIRSLHTMLNGYRVKVVYFYRSKKGALTSLYHQVATDSPEKYSSFPAFLFTLEGSGGPKFPTLNAKQVLEAYASVFGPESITVISYDNMLQANVQPTKELLAVLSRLTQLGVVHAGGSRHENKSRNPDVYALFDYLSTLAVSGPHKEQISRSSCTMDLVADFVTEHDAALPRICSSMTLLLEPWEEAERSYLYSQPFDLRHFDTFPYSNGDEICVLDTKKLTAEWSTWGVKLEMLLGRRRYLCK